MAEHHFHLNAEWPGGRNNVGRIEAGNLKTEISIPPEMDGPGIGTNPDEMLLGAASTCYIITLGAMMERASLPLKTMELQSVGVVDVTNGVFTYKKIIHRPTVVLKEGSSPEELQKTKQLVEKAEQSCMISRAVQGNVSLQLEPNVSIAS
ncbi:OsmC family protein [Sediminibacillus massiliensis]|uniref:OsmC family protein n=1 Tax=Sediminibacillus massiliensis TaxID=1926277 RepID=UPI00098846E7|nr:OsmC family protein [Sediminibacillus massiliensis]